VKENERVGNEKDMSSTTKGRYGEEGDSANYLLKIGPAKLRNTTGTLGRRTKTQGPSGLKLRDWPWTREGGELGLPVSGLTGGGRRGIYLRAVTPFLKRKTCWGDLKKKKRTGE